MRASLLEILTSRLARAITGDDEAMQAVVIVGVCSQPSSAEAPVGAAGGPLPAPRRLSSTGWIARSDCRRRRVAGQVGVDGYPVKPHGFRLRGRRSLNTPTLNCTIAR